MRVALDTNILAYAEGVNGAVRKKAALDIIEKLPAESTFLPVQVLGELFQVLVRKAERSLRVRCAILLRRLVWALWMARFCSTSIMRKIPARTWT